MSECAVGLCHLVHVFFALERTALFVVCVYNFSCELVSHGLAATLAGIDDKIFHRDRLFAVRADLSRNLECGTADTTRLNLYLGVTFSSAFFQISRAVFSSLGNFDFTVSSAV